MCLLVQQRRLSIRFNSNDIRPSHKLYASLSSSAFLVNLLRDERKTNKSSAAVGMGDCGHKRHGLKRGGCAPLSRGALGPRLTQCGLDRCLHPYQVACSSIQPFGTLATIDMGRKLKVVPLLGEMRPHQTQRRLGRGLPPYQVAS